MMTPNHAEIARRGEWPWYTRATDPQSGRSLLLAFDGKRIGIALDVPVPESPSEYPALNYELEITSDFDSERLGFRNAMGMLRKRLNDVRWSQIMRSESE